MLSGYEREFKSFSLAVFFWFLGFLFSSNLLQYVGFVIADRVTYLPSYAFAIVAAEIFSALPAILQSSNRR